MQMQSSPVPTFPSLYGRTGEGRGGGIFLVLPDRRGAREHEDIHSDPIYSRHAIETTHLLDETNNGKAPCLLASNTSIKKPF